MKNTLLKIVLTSLVLCALLWLFFWFCAIGWVNYSNPEASAFLAPAPAGTGKTIGNELLERFYMERHLAVILTFVAALVISQISLLIAAIKK